MRAIPFFLPAILFAFCVAPAAADPFISVVPEHPTTEDDVVVLIDAGPGDLWFIDLAAAYREGDDLIAVWWDECPFPLCGGTVQIIEVAFGKLPSGTYTVHPFNYPTFQLSVTEAEVEAVPPRVDLAISPPVPSDNDRVHAVIPIKLRSCDEPEVSGLERIGNVHRVHVDLPVEDAESPCGERLTSLTADLGQLPAGVQTVQVLTRVGDGQQSQAAMETFVVADGPDSVTLLDRYRVSIEWTTPDGETGAARPVALSSDASALFTFFDPSNWEVMVKVLDGCAINGHRWVFLAAATDVEFELKVEDLQGATEPYVYRSVAGSLTPPLTDTSAILCIP